MLAKDRPVREIDQDKFVGERPSAYAATPWRVLTLLDKLYRDGAIHGGRWRAGRTMADLYTAQKDERSEGVSNLEGAARASQPWRKADRRGRLLTGWEIKPNGEPEYVGGKTNRSARREYADLMWTMCGLRDQSGIKKFDNRAFSIMLRVVSETEHPPTLKQIAMEIDDYYGEKSKQAPPTGRSFICFHLDRVAAYLNEIKWHDWKD